MGANISAKVAPEDPLLSLVVVIRQLGESNTTDGGEEDLGAYLLLMMTSEDARLPLFAAIGWLGEDDETTEPCTLGDGGVRMAIAYSGEDDKSNVLDLVLGDEDELGAHLSSTTASDEAPPGISEIWGEDDFGSCLS